MSDLADAQTCQAAAIAAVEGAARERDFAALKAAYYGRNAADAMLRV